MADETNIFGYLAKLEAEKAEKQRRSRGKEKRITIILSEFDYRRLKFIADDFSTQASVLAREFLVQALNDSEKFLGLNEYTTHPDDGDFYFDNDSDEQIWIQNQSAYGKYINAIGDDDLPDGDFEDEPATKRKKVKELEMD